MLNPLDIKEYKINHTNIMDVFITIKEFGISSFASGNISILFMKQQKNYFNISLTIQMSVTVGGCSCFNWLFWFLSKAISIKTNPETFIDTIHTAYVIFRVSTLKSE